MDFIVEKSTLYGTLTVPPSKSHTLRAILFAAMAKGESIVSHYLPSPDTEAMIRACEAFGALIEKKEERLLIKGVAGKIAQPTTIIDAGNSGLVLRFLSAIAALGSQPVTITGDRSIQEQRPMTPMINALKQLGASAHSIRNNGFAPLTIQGPIKEGRVEINGADSQPVSALMIAATLAEKPITIEVQEAGERPWIDLTLSWLDRFKIKYEREGYEKYHFFGKGHFSAFEYTVPGDWSSAAFPIVAALITDSEITLNNIDPHDAQGDKKIIPLLQQMGADIEVSTTERSLKVKKGKTLKGITIDVNDLIDALPILAVVGCYALGETHLINGAVARQKECDRISAIAQELKKLGAHIEEHPDGLTVRHSPLSGGEVDSHEDHRIGMALCIAGLGATEALRLKRTKCIEKTYHSFFSHLQQLGAVLL